MAIGLLLLQAGCASLPTDVQRPPSFAIMPSDDTSLGRIATASSPDLDLTGFRLLPTGEFALDTRLLLGLAAHPNVEVRLFNPFPAGRARLTTRFLASLFDFNRINRRMHNKLMVFDGAMAIVGGRNIADEYIADEYFMRHEASNFVDLDAFVVGALLPELSQMFDDDWNSPAVFPLHALVPQVQSAERLRADFERRTNSATTSPPPAVPASATDVLGYGPISEELAFGRLGLIWAFATAYADPPGRIKGMGAHYRLLPLTDVQSVDYSVRDMIRGARESVVLTSPYLVPGERGMALIAEQRARGVSFKMLTNSLAATDEPLVHISYRKYRRPLLELGVELYALSPIRVKRASRLGFITPSLGRLHAKSVVVDRSKVFIGSMNFDPRSAIHNTEMGVFIDSAPLAKEVLRLMDLDRMQASFRVMLAPDGGLRWIAKDDELAISFDREPEVDFSTRLWLELLAPLVPEELL